MAQELRRSQPNPYQEDDDNFYLNDGANHNDNNTFNNHNNNNSSYNNNNSDDQPPHGQVFLNEEDIDSTMNDGREIEGENYINIERKEKKKKNRKKRSGSTDSVPGGHAPAPPRPPKPGFDNNPEPEQPAEEEDERQYLTSLPNKRPDTSSSSNAGESRPRPGTSQQVALPTKLPDEKAKKKEKNVKGKSNSDGKGTFNGGFELPPEVKSVFLFNTLFDFLNFFHIRSAD